MTSKMKALGGAMTRGLCGVLLLVAWSSGPVIGWAQDDAGSQSKLKELTLNTRHGVQLGVKYWHPLGHDASATGVIKPDAGETTDPKTEPAPTEPAKPEPADPAKTEPAPTDPSATDPAKPVDPNAPANPADPGKKPAKEVPPEKRPGASVPVILLVHDANRTQDVWTPLAERLVGRGFAVVSFDMQGHGKSTKVDPSAYINPASGKAIGKDTYEWPKRMDGEVQLQRLLADYNAVKRFLIKENNQGRLNLRQFGMVTEGNLAPLLALEVAKQEFDPTKKNVWVEANNLTAVVMLSPGRQHMRRLKFDPKFFRTFNSQDSWKLAVAIYSRLGDSAASGMANMLKVPKSGSRAVKGKRENGVLDQVKVKERTRNGADLLDPPVTTDAGDLSDSIKEFFIRNVKLKKDGREWEEMEDVTILPVFGGQAEK